VGILQNLAVRGKAPSMRSTGAFQRWAQFNEMPLPFVSVHPFSLLLEMVYSMDVKWELMS